MNRHSATNQAWGKWIAGAAVGAVAMFLTDPDRGRRRRALARDKVQHLVHKTSDALEVTSRDLNNRLQGLRAEASRRLGNRYDVSDDQLLVERVRSKLGRAVSHPHAIRVESKQGVVTVSGPILMREKDNVLRMLSGVPGVMDVIDNLEPHDRADVPGLQGGKQRQPLPAFMHENWPPALRAVAAVGGGVLGLYALRRRTPAGMALSALGASLVARSIVNKPFSHMMGGDTSRLPLHMEKSIHIDGSPEAIYSLWTNYENFPHFMSHVQKVEDLGNGRSRWVVNGPGGKQIEWNASMTETRAPELLAWRSEPDSPIQHHGRVRFEPVDGGTRVHVHMHYAPPAGVIGHTVASLFNSDPRRLMEEDLMRMKTFVERGVTPRDAAQPTTTAQQMPGAQQSQGAQPAQEPQRAQGAQGTQGTSPTIQ